jgi:hypothetical protein
LIDITEGRGTEESIALIEELAEDYLGVLCALGGTAGNPVLFHPAILPTSTKPTSRRSGARPGSAGN